MRLATLIVYGLLPLILLVVTWVMVRLYVKREESKIEACVCTAIHKKASKMSVAVERKIAAQDSRARPLPSGKPEETPTEEVPPLRE